MKELANQQAAGLQVFYNESENVSIRTEVIDGEPWFVAKDVARALDISWSGQTLANIPDEWQGMMSFITPCGNYQGGGAQTLKVINEAGLYKLAFRSNKPEADRFVNWIASDVLPSIRRTGSYTAGSQPEERKRLPLPRLRPYFRQWKESLTPYIRRKELEEVAEAEEVTLAHVMKVWAGTSVSRKVAEDITRVAKYNRKHGIIYPEEKPVYEQLMIQWEIDN